MKHACSPRSRTRYSPQTEHGGLPLHSLPTRRKCHSSWHSTDHPVTGRGWAGCLQLFPTSEALPSSSVALTLGSAPTSLFGVLQLGRKSNGGGGVYPLGIRGSSQGLLHLSAPWPGNTPFCGQVTGRTGSLSTQPSGHHSNSEPGHLSRQAAPFSTAGLSGKSCILSKQWP